MAEQTFYVEYKNERGEFEPLGVTSMRSAFEWAFKHEISTLEFCPVNKIEFKK